ncbi:MAG: uracil-DNA glycosylase [Oceanicaulis sp.]|nr:uracil-DNA glycosylase [Oceanicaulis sp.]
MLVNAIVGYENRSVFNPYRDICCEHDVKNAPDIRTSNLKRILSAAQDGCDALWVGRDLGHRGGRRTGLALTDDAHYHRHLGRWGLSAEPPTTDFGTSEVTASVIWGELSRIDARIFLWNVFPFHPHLPENELSNRPHTRSERAVGLQILKALLSELRPAHLVGIGNDAVSALMSLDSDAPVHQLRHPSYGGANIFRAQVRELYGLTNLDEQLNLL